MADAKGFALQWSRTSHCASIGPTPGFGLTLRLPVCWCRWAGGLPLRRSMADTVPVQFDWHETNGRIWVDPSQVALILMNGGYHDAGMNVDNMGRTAERAHRGQVLDQGLTMLPHLVDTGPDDVRANSEVRTTTVYGRVYADLLDIAELYRLLGEARVRASGVAAEMRDLARRAEEPPRRRWFGRKALHG